MSDMGIKKINLREPYGQPHVGSPLKDPVRELFGMPVYQIGGAEVVYWDVHYVKVESINLYANGRISSDYPVSRGHSEYGEVKGQTEWTHERHFKQWIGEQGP